MIANIFFDKWHYQQLKSEARQQMELIRRSRKGKRGGRGGTVGQTFYAMFI
jgi:hypothetical protein